MLVHPFLQSGSEEQSFLFYFEDLIKQTKSFGLGFNWASISFLT